MQDRFTGHRDTDHGDNGDTDGRSWQDEANCLGVDPDLFFPERGASTREAKGSVQGVRRATRLPRVRLGQR